MINRVILSGVIEDNECELVYDKYKPDFCMCEAILVTQDGKKEKNKPVKLTFYNKLAKDFCENIEVYKTHLTMYFGEISHFPSKDQTIIKVNEKPQIIASVFD